MLKPQIEKPKSDNAFRALVAFLSTVVVVMFVLTYHQGKAAGLRAERRTRIDTVERALKAARVAQEDARRHVRVAGEGKLQRAQRYLHHIKLGDAP